MRIGSFSWRHLFGWFLILFGGILAVAIVMSGVLHIVSLQISPHRPVLKGSSWAILTGIVLQFAAAGVWFISGRRILAKQTWPPILGCLAGYVCGVLGAMTLWPDGV